MVAKSHNDSWQKKTQAKQYKFSLKKLETAREHFLVLSVSMYASIVLSFYLPIRLYVYLSSYLLLAFYH